jgi:hypothetical protein
VFYIGVGGDSQKPKSGVGGRIRKHDKTKGDLTHYSTYSAYLAIFAPLASVAQLQNRVTYVVSIYRVRSIPSRALIKSLNENAGRKKHIEILYLI